MKLRALILDVDGTLTDTEDFSTADLVLPSLASADKPLPSHAASLIGSSMLGIREIDRQLNAIRECG
jgi:hypothetical protein